MGWPGLIAAHRRWLDLGDDLEVVTLGEGGTPLLPAPHLSKRLNCQVFLKVEGANPTGSFKDRGMTVAVSKAKAAGASTVVCASTGNTSASAAAYAARAGLACLVLVPDGHVALGKLAQAVAYGARVLQVAGNFDQALDVVRQLGESGIVTVVNSINPDRIEGQKTGAFEIVADLGSAPDYHFIPVGNAGNITAYWRGYRQAQEAGETAKLPAMMGVQAAGAAPLVLGHPVDNPETVATAIRIGHPASWDGAVAAVAESAGSLYAVSDDQILEAYSLLARREAVFCEPASAASVAGLLANPVPAGSTVVCVLTGNGLKDPQTALARTGALERSRLSADDILAELAHKNPEVAAAHQ
jgi:threonine synthase